MHKAILLAALLAAVSCGGSQPATSGATHPATVAVATDAKLGQLLVDGGGHTLYLFEQDTSTLPTCYGACAQYWPPLLAGGTFEVTYAGHPLYYVVTDHNPGDTTGRGVNNFGAPWDVVGPDGKPIG